MEVFECFVCSALDVMLAPLGVIPNGLPRTEAEVEVEARVHTLCLQYIPAEFSRPNSHTTHCTGVK